MIAICRLAYNVQPPLKDVLNTLIGDVKLSTCDTDGLSEAGAKVTVKVFDFQADGDREDVTQDLILKSSDLAFAARDRANISIWPAIVFKALDSIIQDKNLQESDEKPTLLRSQGVDGEPFHCSGGRKYLCFASDLIARLLGIKLESTRRVMEDTKSEQVSITDIFDHAKDGPTVVFKNKALTYIVRENDGEQTFKALWLDMKKSGSDSEMVYRLKKFEEATGIAYKKIKGQHQRSRKDEHADVHIVYPHKEG